MTAYTKVFDAFATILSYPSDEYARQVVVCREALAAFPAAQPDILEHINAFASHINGLQKGELEELYTRTFDINPVSSPEVGWHLHGETYERGAFLVQMRDLLRRCNVEESAELPDHIASVLQAVGRMEEAEAGDFVASRMLKALNKMLEGFAEQANPYEHVLRALQLMLQRSATSHQGVES